MPELQKKFEQFMESENVQKHFVYYKKHMPQIDELDLIVLKGHLLIEEQIDGIIETKTNKYEALSNARLTFFQKASLVEALLGYPNIDWLWENLRNLNGIRNELSHNLNSPKLVTKIDNFLISIEHLYMPEAIPKEILSKSERVLSAIALIYGWLTAILEARRNTKASKL